MAKSQDNDRRGTNQDPIDDGFYGDPAAENRIVDKTALIKTISPGYCGFLPERCKLAENGRGGMTLLGRIGGTMFGIEYQLRDPTKAGKFSPETNPDEYGRAMVGDFNADTFKDDGSIEFFEGGFCYLPGGFQERALARFQSLPDAAKEAGMTFSAFVFSEPSNNPRGYRYVLQNAMRVVEDERLLVTRLRREALLVQKMRAERPLLSDQIPRTIAG